MPTEEIRISQEQGLLNGAKQLVVGWHEPARRCGKSRRRRKKPRLRQQENLSESVATCGAEAHVYTFFRSSLALCIYTTKRPSFPF